MAKKKKVDNKDSTKFDAWKKKYKIDSKEEFDSVKLVADRYGDAKDSLETTCFWDAYTEASTGFTTSGGNWFLRREKQTKAAIMWERPFSSDTFQSNIKSPMTRGRVNTFVNQFKNLNLQFGARPNNREDVNSSIVAEKVMEYWFQNSGAKGELNLFAEDLAIHGSSFFRVHYVSQDQDYQLVQNKVDTKDEKQKKAADEGKTIFGKAETFTKRDDIVLEYVPLNEIYPDPQARCLHGVAYEARWLIRKRTMHIDDFKAEFGKKADAHNVDKVKTTRNYNDDGYIFFTPPESVTDKDLVEVLEMESPSEDKYIVVANDLEIINTPLPWNHKECSYHKADFIKFPGQFWGIGLADLLMNIQGSVEILLNMAADYIYRTYNYRLIVDAKSAGEIGKLLRADSAIIPINIEDGKPLTSKVMPMVNSQIGFDLFQLIDILERNATLASQIDPSQMSLMQTGKTATSSVLNKEQLQAMVGGVIDNIVNEALTPAGRQVWKLMQQFYSIKRAKKITGEDQKEELKFREIRLAGISLDLNKEGILNTQETDDEYTFFEVNDKYLNTKDEIDVYIKPESKDVPSKALDQQSIKEALAQLAPFMVDPNNPQALMQHPMPLINAPKLMQEYFDVNNLPQDLLINKRENEKLATKQAEDHITRILKGENVPGSPGQSDLHRKIEAQVLFALEAKADEIQQKIDKEMESQVGEMEQSPKFDPYTGQPIPLPQPKPSEELQNQLNEVQGALDRLSKHIVIENMPISLASELAVQKPPQPSQPPQGMPPGMSQGMPPQGMPPMPGADTGMVPMPQGMGVQDVLPGFGGAPQA